MSLTAHLINRELTLGYTGKELTLRENDADPNVKVKAGGHGPGRKAADSFRSREISISKI